MASTAFYRITLLGVFLSSSTTAFQLKSVCPTARSLHSLDDSSPYFTPDTFTTTNRQGWRQAERRGDLHYNNLYNDDFYNSQRRRGGDSMNQADYLQSNEYDFDSLVQLSSEGRPMHARVEEWRTAGHTPFTVDSYSQDASARPLRVYSPSRDDSSHTMAIRNTGPMAFPLDDISNLGGGGGGSRIQGNSLRTYTANPSFARGGPQSSWPVNRGRVIDGEGAVVTFPIPAHIQQVHLYISSEGYDVSAHIEVLNGPNCVKQEFAVSSENGREKPFLAIIDTPGMSGHTIRVENTGPMTYPIRADVQPIKNRAGVSLDDEQEHHTSWFDQNSQRQQQRMPIGNRARSSGGSSFDNLGPYSSRFHQNSQRRQQQTPFQNRGNSPFANQERPGPNSRFNQGYQSRQPQSPFPNRSPFDDRERPGPNSLFNRQPQTPLQNRPRGDSQLDGRRQERPSENSKFGQERQSRHPQTPIKDRVPVDGDSSFSNPRNEVQSPSARVDKDQVPTKNHAQASSSDDQKQEFQTPSSWFDKTRRKREQTTDREQDNFEESSMNDRVQSNQEGQNRREDQTPIKNHAQGSSFFDRGQERNSRFSQQGRQPQDRGMTNGRFFQPDASDSFYSPGRRPSAYNMEQTRRSSPRTSGFPYNQQHRQMPSYLQDRSGSSYMEQPRSQTGYHKERVIPSYLRDSFRPTGGPYETPWQRSSDQRRPW